MEFFSQPAVSNRLGDFLKSELSNDWDRFRAAVAFVKRSGTKHISSQLATFASSTPVEIIAGIDHLGTSAEGLGDLLSAVQPHGRVLILHNRLPFTFHPKIFLFSSSSRALAIVGSGNLTEGGLFTNYEAGMRLDLDLTNHAHSAIHDEINATLDQWSDLSSGTTLELDQPLLTRLAALGLVPPESLTKKTTGDEKDDVSDKAADAEAESDAEAGEAEPSPFAAVTVPKAPPAPTTASPKKAKQPTTAAPGPGAGTPSQTALAGFVMTLQTTDVGVGQTSNGTSRRSPEIFIPLGARDMNPGFWGWPHDFVPDTGWTGPIDGNGFGKMDRMGVRVRLGGKNTIINMWYNPDKRDLRLRSEDLRSSGAVGDILRIEKVSGVGYDYYIEIVPTGTTQHPVYLAKCDQSVRAPSKKKYGYY